MIQLPEPGALRAAMPAPDLGRDRAAARAARAWRREADAPRRAVTTLTLADLRRFLECPLQGSVRVLLPMRDDDDADDEAEAALRERENLGDTRVADVARCCAICSRARSTPAPPTTPRWRNATTPRSAGLRLDGTLPSGVFGAVVRTQSPRRCSRSWREGLRAALDGASADRARADLVRRAHPSTGATSRSRPRSRCRCRTRRVRATVALHGRASRSRCVGGDAHRR